MGFVIKKFLLLIIIVDNLCHANITKDGTGKLLENVSETMKKNLHQGDDLILQEDAIAPKSLISTADLQRTVDAMRAVDCNAAKIGDVELNFQGSSSSSHFVDNSPNNLFSRVNEALFTRPTFQAYHRLWDNYHPDENTAEEFTAEQIDEQTEFLDLVMNTQVFLTMWKAVINAGVQESKDYITFREYLRNFWFGLYARGSQKGSSGFEHVFIGEQKHSDGSVGGQHFWMRYYMLEKAGQINYHGVIDHDGILLDTIQYGWTGDDNRVYTKKIGGFYVGNSVEFDFSLFTLCLLTRPNGSGCSYTIDGYRMHVTNYLQTATGGPYVATSYPVIP